MADEDQDDARRGNEPDELDLSPEQPTERADPLIETETETEVPGGFRFRFKTIMPATGTAGVASSVLVLVVAGSLSALALGGLSAFVGAPAWVTVVVAAGAFVVPIVTGVVLSSCKFTGGDRDDR